MLRVVPVWPAEETSREVSMRYGLLGTILIVLLIAFIIKNVFVGGLGGLLLVILIVLLLTGRL